MFGEDFLIKLGFDVDNKELKRLRKQLKDLQGVADKGINKKPQGKEVMNVRKILTLEKKRLAIRKKMDRLRELGHTGSMGRFVGSMRSKKSEVLDTRLVELDELLRVATNNYKKQNKISAEMVKKAREKSGIEKEIAKKRREGAIYEARIRRMRARAMNDFSHAFAVFGAAYTAFATIRDAQQVKFNMENAESQMQIAFGDKAEGMMSSFVASVKGLNQGIGKVASMETLSQVAPALRGRFSDADTQGIARELLVISKFSGQLGDMAAIARNFGQMTTSLEGEDVNQFADRMKGLMPFIYENLVKMGKITEASRGSFMKAKEQGKVVSEDFVQAFRMSVQRITKDEKLLAKLGGKLTVSWGILLAGIEDARLSFMGKLKDDDTITSMSEHLANAYLSLTSFFDRNEGTWSSWGQVLGEVVEGLVKGLLWAELGFVNFAIFLKEMFDLSDNDARNKAIWIALGSVLLPLIGTVVLIGSKLKKLLSIFGIVGSAGAAGGAGAAGTGFIGAVASFAVIVSSLAAGIAAFTASVALFDSLMIDQDGGYNNAKTVTDFLGIDQESLPDWLFTGVGGANNFDKMLAEQKKWEEQLTKNTYSKVYGATDEQKAMYKPIGMSPREKALKYGLGAEGTAKYNAAQTTVSDNKTVTNNYTINESTTPVATAKSLSKMQESSDTFFTDVLAMSQ